MTHVYFVRHAEPDFSVHDDATRPLTEKGEASSVKLVDHFVGVDIDVFVSSPYKRAVDTIKPLADDRNAQIQTMDDLRERKITDGWIEDFSAFTKKQWDDFDYKLEGGESLREVQSRNTKALSELLETYSEKTIVVGTHGTSLSTILHNYDGTFDLSAFEKIKNKMPWIVKMTFEKAKLARIDYIECGA